MSAEQLDVTAESSQSSSADATNGKTKDASPLKSKYLGVPLAHPRRRSSLDSTFSELSELSFYSDEMRNSRPLMAPDQFPEHSLPRARGWRGQVRSFWIRNKGMLLVLAAMFFGSGMNIGTRLLETPGPHGEPMHPYQILFVRQSITASCCTIYGLYTKKIPDFPLGPKKVRLLLVTRGLSGFFGVFGLYFSLLYLPLAEATVLTFLAPILTCYVCSILIPGETFSRQQQLAGFVSLLGVVFIANPASMFNSAPAQDPSGLPVSLPTNSTATLPDTSHYAEPTAHEHLLAISIAMVGVLGATGALTSIRAIGTQAHPFLSVNYFSVWCTIVSLACLVIFPSVSFRLPGNMLEWSLLAMLGSCGFVMQVMLTIGLAYGGPSGEEDRNRDVEERRRDIGRSDRTNSSSKDVKASGTRATSMLYTQMLFALAGDSFIFGVTPSAMSWIGSGLILAGAMWVAAAKDATKSDSEEGALEKENLAFAGSEGGEASIGAERSNREEEGGGRGRVGEREVLMDSQDGGRDIEMDDLASGSPNQGLRMKQRSEEDGFSPLPQTHPIGPPE